MTVKDENLASVVFIFRRLVIEGVILGPHYREGAFDIICKVVGGLECQVITVLRHLELHELRGIDAVALFFPVIAEDVVLVVPVTAVASAFLEHATGRAIAAITPHFRTTNDVAQTFVPTNDLHLVT